MTTSFAAIGTQWQIDIDDLSPAKLAGVLEQIAVRIEDFDAAYSRFRADSLVSSLKTGAGSIELPADGQRLLGLYRRYYDVTGGKFTPLIGQVLSAAGYDAAYSLKPGILTSPPAWDEVLSVTDATLVASAPVELDFGAAGKGFLVDEVVEIIEAAGSSNYCVDASGDLRVRRPTPLRVGLEDPSDASRVIGVAELTDGALCASAANRRAWQGFHHVFDPQLLASPPAAAIWVTAATAAEADALTTALNFASVEELSTVAKFEALIYEPGRRLEVTPGFPAELFL